MAVPRSNLRSWHARELEHISAKYKTGGEPRREPNSNASQLFRPPEHDAEGWVAAGRDRW